MPERAAPIRSPEPVEAPAPPELEPSGAATRTPRADLAQEAVASAPETTAGDARDDEAEPTRRGFFARLFGRRARSQDEREQLPPERDPTAEADRPRDEADEQPAQADRPRATEDTSSEPIQPTALEALQARFAVRPPPPEPPPVPEKPVVTNAPATPRDIASAEPERPSGADPAPEPTASIDAQPQQPTSLDAPPEPAAVVDPDPEQAAGDTLSSELRRAEEIAAEDVRAAPTEEQVEEILTGVLDRLGAAHHRPFSRA